MRLKHSKVNIINIRNTYHGSILYIYVSNYKYNV